MAKCILLSRVSTEKQDLDQQTNELMKAAHNAGYTDNDIILIQDKESAIKLSFEERKDIIQKYISKVTVYKKGPYLFDIDVDGTMYQMNTNSSCRWIKTASNEVINYEYLERYKRKY